MLLGIIPLMITIYWIVSSFVTTDHNHKREVADLVTVYCLPAKCSKV